MKNSDLIQDVIYIIILLRRSAGTAPSFLFIALSI
nr:MAG TPA: hypothetical protein [Bacteriophage sp.]